MAIRDVGFRIKLPLARETVDAQKSIDKQRKTLVDMDKKTIPALARTTKDYLRKTKDGFRDTERAADDMGRSFSRSMDDGLRALNKFGGSLDKLKSKVINFKTMLAGTAVGVAAVWAGHKLYEGGKQKLATEGRIGREFGADAELLKSIAGKAGRRGGLSEDDAIKGLIPFRERLDDIEAGAQFRGMRKKLTATEADRLREKNLAFGANLLSRVSTLAPDLDQGQVGSVLADALSGPEGIRRLMTEFNLSKKSRTISAANEKGDVFKLLRDDEKKKYGITKHGQFLEQGDLVNVLLERSGITEGAADAKRKKFDFQVKSIGAQAETALADIGARALEKFNSGMAKGATLAEKFENALKSKEGQKALEAISNTVVKIADGALAVATSLPKVGEFLSDHKTSLLSLGAVFAGLKGMSAIGGRLGSGGGIAGAVGGVPHVWVDNMGAGGGGAESPGGLGGKVGKGNFLGTVSSAVTALAVGYSIGSYLDEKFDLSGKLVDWMGSKEKFAKRGEAMAAPFAATLKAREDTRKAKIAELEKQGFTHGQAVYNSEHPNQPIQLTVNLDGRVLATTVTEHQKRGIQTATAHGAARTTGE